MILSYYAYIVNFLSILFLIFLNLCWNKDSLCLNTTQHKRSIRCKHRCQTGFPVLKGWCTSSDPAGRTQGQSWPERKQWQLRRWWQQLTWPRASWCRRGSGKVAFRQPVVGSATWAFWLFLYNFQLCLKSVKTPIRHKFSCKSLS